MYIHKLLHLGSDARLISHIRNVYRIVISQTQKLFMNKFNNVFMTLNNEGNFLKFLTKNEILDRVNFLFS